MTVFNSPTSAVNRVMNTSILSSQLRFENAAGSSHPSFPHLVLLVFEAVLEVVCVSLPGYIAARHGMFDAEAQKLVANLNVALFTPCLVFTKLASQLTAKKLTDLAIIPVIFAIQTAVSYLCSIIVSRCFRFKKRKSNFVTAMAVFGNSNSLPISLVMSLSQTLKGLHWNQIPNDNDGEVAARGILYLLIFQQLGQLVRWSWGYHILLAPKDQYPESIYEGTIEDGQTHYTDNPDQSDPDEPLLRTRRSEDAAVCHTPSSIEHGDHEIRSGSETPVTVRTYSYAKLSTMGGSPGEDEDQPVTVLEPDSDGPFLPRQSSSDQILSFKGGLLGWTNRFKQPAHEHLHRAGGFLKAKSNAVFESLPLCLRKWLSKLASWTMRFSRGLWVFMNPPLWAMLIAIIVASVPSLQRLFFDDGTFVRNSVTRAIDQNGQVAVPLILVVLGANLAKNTLPKEDMEDLEDSKGERNLIIASLVARMLLPGLLMAPILAFLAKYAPVSILDDPIFIVVCFLLAGAPSALQLAQICQINNVYMGAMSKLLFQSYVIWILPSTLVLVMCALEVLAWATRPT